MIILFPPIFLGDVIFVLKAQISVDFLAKTVGQYLKVRTYAKEQPFIFQTMQTELKNYKYNSSNWNSNISQYSLKI